jgi:transposase-like protein
MVKGQKAQAVEKSATGQRIIYSDAERNEAVERLRKGEKAESIASDMGMSLATVRNWKKQAGLTVSRKGSAKPSKQLTARERIEQIDMEIANLQTERKELKDKLVAEMDELKKLIDSI